MAPNRTEDLATLVEIGESLLSQGDIEGSLKAFDAALGVDPESTESLLGSAAAFVEIGSFDDAYSYLDVAIGVAPEDPDTWRAATAVALAAGDGQTASRAATRRIELEGDGAEAETDLAVAAFLSLDVAAARGAAARAHQLDPEHEAARFWHDKLDSLASEHEFLVEVARAYCRRGQYAKGIELFDRALDVGDSYDARLYSGRALFAVGEMDAATRQFNEALHFAPGDPAALMDFAEASGRIGEPLRVRWAAEQLLERDPASEDGRAMLAWADSLEASRPPLPEPQAFPPAPAPATFCRACGMRMLKGATFCVSCGARMT